MTLLYVLEFLMFGRALMSWFSPDEDNKIARFLFLVTEPFVYPIRQLLNRFEFFSSIPIDMSFLFAMIVLILCTTLLSGTIA
ncbi:MAG: YggT family protein [Oscillospiraceae bacterium]|nr:YggT family protein [Oscillospiraceae bacterium]